MAIQNIANTGTTPILTIDYDRMVEDDIPLQSQLVAAFPRKGSDQETGATTYRFGLLTGTVPTTRVTPTMPDNFVTTDGAPTRENVDVGFKCVTMPYRYKQDIRDLGTKKGALIDVLADDLEQIPAAWAHTLEWKFCTSDTTGILFQVSGTPSTTTATVKNYGGLSGEEIGVLLETLALKGFALNASSGSGANARNNTAAVVVSVDSTPGAETITFDRDVQADGWVNNDIIYLSRQDSTNRVQTVGDDIAGVPLLCDDYTLLATYQDLTASTAPSFKAKRYFNGGVKRELDETMLSVAIAAAQARAGRRQPQDGEWGLGGYAILSHRLTLRRFADRARQDRRFNVPLGETMLKFAAGVEYPATTFMGIPFLVSDLHPRNRVHVMDFDHQFILHNGPIGGQWFPDAAPADKHRVSGSSTYEVARYAWLNLASRKRNCNAVIGDLVTDSLV